MLEKVQDVLNKIRPMLQKQYNFILPGGLYDNCRKN
jgi:hypothetical protein